MNHFTDRVADFTYADGIVTFRLLAERTNDSVTISMPYLAFAQCAQFLEGEVRNVAPVHQAWIEAQSQLIDANDNPQQEPMANPLGIKIATVR